MGRPNGRELKYSLSHIVDSVQEILGVPVKFCNDCIGNEAIEAVDSLKEGEVILMENVRFYPEETVTRMSGKYEKLPTQSGCTRLYKINMHRIYNTVPLYTSKKK